MKGYDGPFDLRNRRARRPTLNVGAPTNIVRYRPSWPPGTLNVTCVTHVAFEIVARLDGDECLDRAASVDPLRSNVDNRAVDDDQRRRDELAEFDRRQDRGARRERTEKR